LSVQSVDRFGGQVSLAEDLKFAFSDPSRGFELQIGKNSQFLCLLSFNLIQLLRNLFRLKCCRT